MSDSQVGIDMVSWLICHPESKAVGRDLQTLIWQAEQKVLSGLEVLERGQKLQSELEALKRAMPDDVRFLSCCVFAVGDLMKEFGQQQKAPTEAGA